MNQIFKIGILAHLNSIFSTLSMAKLNLFVFAFITIYTKNKTAQLTANS